MINSNLFAQNNKKLEKMMWSGSFGMLKDGKLIEYSKPIYYDVVSIEKVKKIEKLLSDSMKWDFYQTTRYESDDNGNDKQTKLNQLKFFTSEIKDTAIINLFNNVKIQYKIPLNSTTNKPVNLAKGDGFSNAPDDLGFFSCSFIGNVIKIVNTDKFEYLKFEVSETLDFDSTTIPKAIKVPFKINYTKATKQVVFDSKDLSKPISINGIIFKVNQIDGNRLFLKCESCATDAKLDYKKVNKAIEKVSIYQLGNKKTGVQF